MKIELKNIKHSPSLSEETEAFTADLYIGGKHVAFVRNDGRGGNTDFNATESKHWDTIKEAEAYCKTLPQRSSPGLLDDNGKPMLFDVTLEDVANDLLNDYLNRKDLAKIRRNEVNQIIYGNLDRGFATGIKFKRPLANILSDTKGEATIIACIQKDILPELKDGIKILNQNIPEEIFLKAGLNKDQYTSPQTAREKLAPKKEAGIQPRKGHSL